MTPEHLFRLRTAVARHGEQDVANWWPTQGLLGSQGHTLYRRSFPRTHPFARARVVGEAAKSRVRDLYPVKDALTLWTLPAELEEQMDLARQEWLRDVDRWTSFFNAIEEHKNADLVSFLDALDLISDTTRAAVDELTAPANGPAVKVPGTAATTETIELLAAAHALGKPGSPVVPHLEVGR